MFFSLLGVAGTLVSLYRPEKDEFSNRVRILFGGRQDETVDYIREAIRKIGYYAEMTERSYKISRYDRERNAYLVRMEDSTITRNYYDDLAAIDKARWTLTPDKLTPPLDPLGHLISFRVNGEHKITEPIPIFEKGLQFEEDVQIPRGETSRIEVCSDCWHLLTETHTFVPHRFAKRIQISVIYEAENPGLGAPAIKVLEPSSHGEISLMHSKQIVFPPMLNCRPNEHAFAFQLIAPRLESS